MPQPNDCELTNQVNSNLQRTISYLTTMVNSFLQMNYTIITAHVRKDGGRYCFQFVSSHRGPHPRSRWGVPHPRSRGYPIPGPGGGVPIPGPGGGYPILLMGGKPPPPQSRLDGVLPSPGLDGLPPPPIQDWMGTPSGDQHSEHLLYGGRCASCIHAGGHSCVFSLFVCPQGGTPSPVHGPVTVLSGGTP